jgi:hypothetical protein
VLISVTLQYGDQLFILLSHTVFLSYCSCTLHQHSYSSSNKLKTNTGLRSEVFTLMKTWTVVFWIVMLNSHICGYHLQDCTAS